MTPAARLSAAITVLDSILAGQGAEQALTGWGRVNRYAGSGDRAAVRDLVFDALRCKRSFAALGGGISGRGLVLGGQRAAGAGGEALFTGEGHAPARLGPEDTGRAPDALEALDCPEWLAPALQDSLGVRFAGEMQALRHRAAVYLRVNLGKASRERAQQLLAAEGIATEFVQDVKTALCVAENARKIAGSKVFLEGLVELQDAASQAVVLELPLREGMRVLDCCAGGGGKTLALAALGGFVIFAHDAAPRRMQDLPARAARAGAAVTILENLDLSERYDVILADAPCSGSGSWRRDPQGKWALTPGRLAELVGVQAGILDRMAPLVAPGGVLAYATCSLLRDENESQAEAFLARNPGWLLQKQRRFFPSDGADGFFLAIFARMR